MKGAIFSLILTFSALGLFAQGTKIEKVKIFRSGAEISRSGILKLDKGIQTITIKGLSPFVNQSSIQAKIKGAKIVDIKYHVDYVQINEENQKVLALKNQISSLDLDIQKEENLKSSLNLELDLIIANQNLKGEETLDIEDLKEFVNYYKIKIPELKGKISDSENQLKKFRLVRSKLEKQLKETEILAKEASGVIEFIIECATTQTGKLLFNYHTSGCSWEPKYNIRAKDLDSNIDFEYNALVNQNTGVNWDNVKISLITGNPVVSGTHPTLSPWVINDPYDYPAQKRYSKGKMDVSNYKIVTGGYSLPEPSLASENLTFSEFNIIRKQTIETGTKNKLVVINQYSLPASYNYYAVPKLDNGVHLLANVSGWEELFLVPGKANVYYDNTYVGNSYISPSMNNDTMAVSLGQDQSIIIERNKIHELCSTKPSGLNIKKNRAYKISIKNNRQKQIDIKILDQIPVSELSKVKVELKNQGGAKFNSETGILEWNFKVPANDLKSANFEFEVKHPKKYSVRL